jgi:hypothetical protein
MYAKYINPQLAHVSFITSYRIIFCGDTLYAIKVLYMQRIVDVAKWRISAMETLHFPEYETTTCHSIKLRTHIFPVF